MWQRRFFHGDRCSKSSISKSLHRSTYSAEFQGTEEAADVGIFCRGLFASFLGYPMNQPRALDAICAIPLALETDAKDAYETGTSDTPTYGAQKSLAFTVAWLRLVFGTTQYHVEMDGH